MRHDVIEVFACYNDEGDDRTTIKGQFLGVCRTEEDADLLVAGQGWYGGPGIVERTHAAMVDVYMLLLAHPEPVEFVNMDEKKAAGELDGFNKALGKLSDDDLKTLGIEHLRPSKKARRGPVAK